MASLQSRQSVWQKLVGRGGQGAGVGERGEQGEEELQEDGHLAVVSTVPLSRCLTQGSQERHQL